MSWQTKKTTIAGSLTGYTEVEYNLDVEDESPRSRKHKAYNLNPIGGRAVVLGATATHKFYYVELKVGYIVPTVSKFSEFYDDFLSLCCTILETNNIGEPLDDPSFIRSENDNKYAIGTLTFQIGDSEC